MIKKDELPTGYQRVTMLIEENDPTDVIRSGIRESKVSALIHRDGGVEKFEALVSMLRALLVLETYSPSVTENIKVCDCDE